MSVFNKIVVAKIRNTSGEELLIIVPNVTKEELEAFAEKLRKEIEEHHFFKVGKKTCSFGLTISKELDNENSIVSRADKTLYKAKTKEEIENFINSTLNSLNPLLYQYSTATFKSFIDIFFLF